MTKRHILGYALSLLPASICSSVRKSIKGNFLTVLAYHRIMDRPENFPFDDDLISASIEGFRKQMRFVSKHYNVTNFIELSEHIDKYGKLPERSLIVTFDDGYIDNYTFAYPVLAELGLTAVMFVTAGYIGEKRLFWWDRIAYIVKNTEKEEISIKEPEKLKVRIDSHPSKQDVARMLIKKAKRLPDSEKEIFIEKLSVAAGVPVESVSVANTMNWEQVKELAEAGIEIGSHSVNHPIFSNVSPEQIEYEVIESKKIIESKIQKEVISFGAPGRGIIPIEEKKRFEEILEGSVTKAGYKFSTRYSWGLVYERNFKRLRISRLGIEMHDTPGLFKAKLAFPEILRY